VLGEHDELVASPPEQLVGGSQVLAQTAREFDQDAVADLMPMGVVDALEVIDVDERSAVACSGAVQFRARRQRAHRAGSHHGLRLWDR
jgi:hypothetical protein